MYLAQIAFLIARTAGGSEATVADFLLDPVDEPEDLAAAAKEAFGFSPRNRKD